MVVSPVVGRLSTRVAPRAFGVPALLVMAAALFALSTLAGGAVLLGARRGGSRCSASGWARPSPPSTIGSMGSIRGQELGLGSGIVNMARQVGFAIGIALFVAVFTGTIDDERAPGPGAHRAAALPAPATAAESPREIHSARTSCATPIAGVPGGRVRGPARDPVLAHDAAPARGRPRRVRGGRRAPAA